MQPDARRGTATGPAHWKRGETGTDEIPDIKNYQQTDAADKADEQEISTTSKRV